MNDTETPIPTPQDIAEMRLTLVPWAPLDDIQAARTRARDEVYYAGSAYGMEVARLGRDDEYTEGLRYRLMAAARVEDELLDASLAHPVSVAARAWYESSRRGEGAEA